jgi:hypothetical protein
MTICARLKPLIYIALAALTFSGVSFFLWLSVNGDQAEVQFGRVTAVATSSFMIADRHRAMMLVSIVDETNIARGNDTLLLSDVAVGDFVQVTGVETSTGMAARTVLIMKPPKERPGYEAAP